MVPVRIDNIHIEGEIYLWESLPEDSQGDFLAIRGNNDITVWVLGDDGGGTVTIEGAPLKDSNLALTLDDVNGESLTFLSNGVKSVGPAVPFLRPVVNGGLNASVNVYAFVIRKGR